MKRINSLFKPPRKRPKTTDKMGPGDQGLAEAKPSTRRSIKSTFLALAVLIVGAGGVFLAYNYLFSSRPSASYPAPRPTVVQQPVEEPTLPLEPNQPVTVTPQTPVETRTSDTMASKPLPSPTSPTNTQDSSTTPTQHEEAALPDAPTMMVFPVKRTHLTYNPLAAYIQIAHRQPTQKTTTPTVRLPKIQPGPSAFDLWLARMDIHYLAYVKGATRAAVVSTAIGSTTIYEKKPFPGTKSVYVARITPDKITLVSDNKTVEIAR